MVNTNAEDSALWVKAINLLGEDILAELYLSWKPSNTQ